MKQYLRTLLLFVILFPCRAFAQWSVPVVISPGAMNASMNENMGPCIASSHDTIHVIWSDHRTKGYAVYYTRSIDSGHTWSPALAITDTMGRGRSPSIAVSGKNVHVVWWDSIGPNACSYYEHSIDGGNTWATKICIDSNTEFWPGVAVSGSTVLVSINKFFSGGSVVFLTKSTDNGMNFGPEQQVSTRVGAGRSEDQGTATDGKYIHMCWNDNRNNPNILEIYYRRSKDMGVTWDTEVDLTDTSSYSPMVFIDSAQVNVAFGYGRRLNSFIVQSVDSGNTRKPANQVTTNANPSDFVAYPSMVCNGKNLYMVSLFAPTNPWGVWFNQSTDGGATWSSQTVLGSCHGTAFIALTCPVLHVVWPDSGKIYYTRNPTGASACSNLSAGVENAQNSNTNVSIYPDPVLNNATISFGEEGTHQVEIYDITGRKISGFICTNKEHTFSCSQLSPGMYFIKAGNEKNIEIVKLIKE